MLCFINCGVYNICYILLYLVLQIYTHKYKKINMLQKKLIKCSISEIDIYSHKAYKNYRNLLQAHLIKLTILKIDIHINIHKLS